LQRSVAACLAAILELDVGDIPLPDEPHPDDKQKRGPGVLLLDEGSSIGAALRSLSRCSLRVI
jgi:hypothetical protein